jgi:tRNA (guanine-N7-)-methyltransferase
MRFAANSVSVQPPKFLSSFGRNRGRSLRPYQQQLVDVLLPTLAPNVVAPKEGFTSLALEIGFGGGEHLLAQAAHNPDTLFIGCEPFINGVAKCLAGIDQQKLRNIRLFTRDARELIAALPDACIDSAFILFPDPWPKLRHNKRRLINAETLAMLARIHKKVGRLLIATDHVDYSVWILEVLQNNPHYQWTAREQADWKTPPKDWTETKYQRKTTEQGREPVFMECVRVG